LEGPAVVGEGPRQARGGPHEVLELERHLPGPPRARRLRRRDRLHRRQKPFAHLRQHGAVRHVGAQAEIESTTLKQFIVSGILVSALKPCTLNTGFNGFNSHRPTVGSHHLLSTSWRKRSGHSSISGPRSRAGRRKPSGRSAAQAPTNTCTRAPTNTYTRSHTRGRGVFD